jgi:hypothetical protein
MRCCSRLRQCATNRKVAVSIDNIYDSGVVSGSKGNKNQEYVLAVKAAGVYGWKSYNLPVPIVYNSWNLNLLELSEPVQACTAFALHVSFAVSTTYLL